MCFTALVKELSSLKRLCYSLKPLGPEPPALYLKTNMFKSFIARRYALCALVLSVGGLALALVLQHGFGMAPCPLCITQRMALVVTALCAAVALAVPQRYRAVFSWSGAAASAAGLSLASWHTYKMLVPSTATTCAEGLGFWLDNLWFSEHLPFIFAPRGDCIQDAANLLGTPLPAYSVVLFLAIAIFFRLNAINAKSPSKLQTM